jgi:hypothetical protein
MSRKYVTWTPEMVSLLGTVNDRELGEQLGVRTEAVWLKRKSLGIPQCGHTEWTKEMEDALPSMSDAEIIKKFDLKIQPSAVAARRRKLGIPGPGLRVTKWTDEMIAKLGTMHDNDLGPILGIHPATVGAKRQRLGIPPWQKPDKKIDEY